MRSSTKVVGGVIVIAVLAVFGLQLAPTPSASRETTGPQTRTPSAWMEVPLTDARTGQTFRLSDFRGKLVVLEVMAIWCPLCKDQADQIKQLQRRFGDRVVFVSIDVDPNENADLLARYATRNGYNWPYVYDSTGAIGRTLIRNVASEIPETPVYLIDATGQLTKLSPGIKSARALAQAIEAKLG